MLGALFLRYDSVIGHIGNAYGLFVANPWCVPGSGLARYIEHPLSGLGTFVGHTVSAFTFNHLFTYIYDWNAVYSPALAALMWIVVALGVLQGLRLALRRLTLPPPLLVITVAASALFVLGIGALAFVAVENRFAALPLAVLSVLAAHFLLTYRGRLGGCVCVDRRGDRCKCRCLAA
jgi:hypothetical protein